MAFKNGHNLRRATSRNLGDEKIWQLTRLIHSAMITTISKEATPHTIDYNIEI